MNPIAMPFNHSRTISSVSFDPTGRLLAMGCTNGTVCVWSFYAKKLVYDEAFSSNSEITSISWTFTGDAMILMCGARDGSFIVSPSIQLAGEGKVIGHTILRGHPSAVIKLVSLLFSLVSAAADELCMWSCPDGMPCERQMICDASRVANGASIVDIALAESSFGVVIFFDNGVMLHYSLLTDSVIWSITNPNDYGVSFYLPGSLIVCTKHPLQLAMTGTECPRIRQIAADATHCSHVEDSENLFLIHTLDGNIMVWDAELGDVLFYCDTRDFDKPIRKLAAYYNSRTQFLRIVACPETSTECVVWNLHRYSRKNPSAPTFIKWRDIEAGVPSMPKGMSERPRPRRIRKAAAAAASVALRRSTRQRRVPARFRPLPSGPVI
ncbi:hypothetical protein BD410DRAFT_846586 [Rickenella mellea]|uniref:Uncharacterized protein n=1 Tax=Rickenella mellea TaxID=50990 RepID=A0A4Y7PEP3_9AGAM|nr:hypothetical protein BD410DRAFT_846586 [Rickenella mellea]